MKRQALLLLAIAAMTQLAIANPQSVLASTWQEGYANANGIRIHYWRTGGDKPPLILLHGFSDDGLCWTTIARELTDRFDIIMPDARGHGLFDRHNKEDPADVQVEDLRGLIESLELKDPIVMGHSMGSSSAAWFAARYPSIPKAVILVDPRLVQRDPSESARRPSVDYQKSRAASILERNNMDYESLFDTQMKKFPHWGLTELHFRVISKQRHHPNTAYRDSSRQPSIEKSFAKIIRPTLILKADDPKELQAKNHAVASILSDGSLIHIEGAGHSVHRDRKDLFLEALNAFLNRL